MKVLFKINLILFIALMLFLPQVGHTADRAWEQINEYGYIDWLNQRVYATGMGLPPQETSSETQAKTLAYRAAVVVAQRNLLEVIKGVHIDSQTILEKRIVADDTIVSRIKGIIKFSRVEKSQMLADGAVTVTISMPLSGKMGEVIIRAIEDPGKQTFEPASNQDLANRILQLENRVAALENQLLRLSNISAEQKATMHLLTYLLEAWQQHLDSKNQLLTVGFATDEETAALRHQLDEQKMQLASMSIHLNTLSRRLESIENNLSTTSEPAESGEKIRSYPYTGLIVDARDTGFKPSLRPELYGRGKRIYPSNALNLSEAVKNGYVRYFNNRHQAQQSDRVGALPFATKATGTYGGNRGLSLNDKATQIIETILGVKNNFLDQGRVVIIF